MQNVNYDTIFTFVHSKKRKLNKANKTVVKIHLKSLR